MQSLTISKYVHMATIDQGSKFRVTSIYFLATFQTRVVLLVQYLYFHAVDITNIAN